MTRDLTASESLCADHKRTEFYTCIQCVIENLHQQLSKAEGRLRCIDTGLHLWGIGCNRNRCTRCHFYRHPDAPQIMAGHESTKDRPT